MCPTPAPEQAEEQLLALCARLDVVIQRLGELEAAVGLTAADALRWRQVAVLNSISELEAACGITSPRMEGSLPGAPGQSPAAASVAAARAPAAAAPPVTPPASAAPASAQAAAAAAPGVPAVLAVDPSGSPIQQRLQAELLGRGLAHHRFVRAPPEYYDRHLEFRRDVLQAASVEHLCKSIVMENTRAHPDISGPSTDPAQSKYFLIIVQYTARLHAEKLKVAVHRMCGGRYSRKHFNMRLAPEEVSDELTGFSHNSVSPIGIRTQLPVVLSHRITQLTPDFFWLGAGEVDLKVGMSAAEFVKAYQPIVIDCTYNEEDNGGSTEG